MNACASRSTARRVKECFAPYDLVKTMRASILVLGPLVARYGRADVSLPGGCAIGARPVNIHVAGLQAMGADITIEGGYIRARAGRLKGARLVLDTVTVTGTENLMMAATLADGETVIENAAREPEVVDLANFLIAMGAKIDGAGTDKILITGVEKLRGTSYEVLPDRIESGTYLVAGAITRRSRTHQEHASGSPGRGAGEARGGRRQARRRRELDRGRHARPASSRRWTCAPRRTRPSRPTCRRSSRRSTPWPRGVGTITETIFENRFMHMLEMRRLGAEIRLEGNTAIIHGVEKLTAAPVMATDLRASASLVLAGLVAEGRTDVERIYHIDRGYEAIEEKLAQLGRADPARAELARRPPRGGAVRKEAGMQIGMIGLGRMGANMVRRLVKGGHECVAYDPSAKAVAEVPATARRARTRSRTSSPRSPRRARSGSWCRRRSSTR